MSFDASNAPRPGPHDALVRGVWCWPALLPAVAIVLDLGAPPPVLLGVPWRWLDGAALVALGWASLGPGRARLGDWPTPMDGRVAAGLALAVLHVLATPGQARPIQWLHLLAGAGLCYYALAARLRRDPLAADAVWPSFAVAALALGGLVIATATQGLPALASLSAMADERWSSHEGLAKSLAVATVLCAGRAAEDGARPLWRVTALVGALATGLLAMAGGLGLHLAALANLDEPFPFGTSIVAFLFLMGLARMAWQLAHDHPPQAPRWRATAIAYGLVVVLLTFGGTTGGEGVRGLLALMAAGTIAARLAPRAEAAASPASEPSLRRAA